MGGAPAPARVLLRAHADTPAERPRQVGWGSRTCACPAACARRHALGEAQAGGAVTPGRPLLRAHVGFVLWELVHISVRDSQGRARAQGAGRVTPQLPFLRATGRHLAFLSRFCSLGLGGASWLLPLQSGPQLLNLSI